MEPNETTVEATAENLVEAVEVVTAKPSVAKVAVVEAPKPVVVEPTPSSTVPTSEIATPQLPEDIWKQINQLWDQYFGEGKKDNLTIAIAVIATIPVLIAVSALLDFLNHLPLLPSIFELVGFVYSLWFIYRYLLLATTRKELTDTISAWKQKVFG
ncbi:hypothetical protein H6F42_03755 [Pseudanabaena sp. FACHB-1998]|uniref:CAAD domain-containing protein n=1 Tax=Pseudanabaena sp. FACHB-1998 TaxID=2692858 RepID=UPI0016803F19|nr:CAAD domain-containing protein [Pseudanabaena sp. FACHB-1998]MBD2176035.1 hypothetical protein [Pseudanabaena sp. FACHB-1998]